MLEMILLCAVSGTGDVWFTPRPGNEEWWVQGQLTSVACCYQFSLPPEQA